MVDLHVGRSWQGHPLEDGCPCTKARCGLVTGPTHSDCTEHDGTKTLRQVHAAADCPSRGTA